MSYIGRKGQTAPLASADLPTNSISTAHLINDAVTSAKIGVDVIVAEDIANNAVTVAELSDNAVTQAKLADNAVGTAEIAADAVTGAKLANDIAITTTGALTGTIGDFNWDSNTLVVDSSESRVGVGTAAPAGDLHLSESGASEVRLQMTNSNTGHTSGDGFAVVQAANGTDMYVYNYESGTINFGTANSTRMTIDSSGEVLIGTTTQGRETDLAIVGPYQEPTGAWSQVGIYSNDSQSANTGGTLMFGGQDGTTARQWFSGIKGAKENATSGNYAGYLAFYTRPAGSTPVERMRIDSSGYVGINQSSPSSFTTLGNTDGHLVIGNGNGTCGVTCYTGSSGYGHVAFGDTLTGGDSYDGLLQYHQSNHTFRIYTNHTIAFGVDGSGTFTGSGSADISDKRLKENITTIPDALTKINALTGRTFTWKEEAKMQSGTQYGLIAQELETVIPDLVHNNSGIRVFDKDDNLKPDAMEPSGTDEWSKSIHMSGCIPILIEAVKELSAKVTALENA